ncbi:MAG: DEAD/DEAH box helicase family protein [Fusobacteriaceae bacterium]|jgi:superfamily II DNA or RNA helicase|nr:DEAD/DEAH box helicase family protein [Fusobacteriaceae bacterium]
MGFKDLNIKMEYRIPEDNIVKDFYIPLLERSRCYKRSVGYFSSSALLEFSKGLTYLIKNGGRILLITSPYLEEEDVKAINKGYELRNDIIETILLKYFTEPVTSFDKESLNLIATLIAQERLDIKIAFSYKDGKQGLYHEKMGIFYDDENNQIAFSGSMNETKAALTSNYEVVEVFTSWSSDEGMKRVQNKERAFDDLWNDRQRFAKVYEFPKNMKEMILKYKKDEINFDILKEIENTMEIGDSENTVKFKKHNIPEIPDDVNLHLYQKEAIENWEKNEYRGIFDMATGTGKTYTGLGSIVRLYNAVKGKLAVIIVCPYKHLVEQWVEDIREFNINPIIGYSDSQQKDWLNNLKYAIKDQILEINRRKFFCFICTNTTFSSTKVQKELNEIKDDVLLLIDEAHNFGARHLRTYLNEKYKYRLALSATIERHNDNEGTDILLKYFGERCIEYTLGQAITDGKLTPYYYYPIPVYFDPDELYKYNELTEKIAKLININKNKPQKNVEILLIKRARIIAAAKNKLKMLYEIIESKYKNKKHILVYCGATTIENFNYKEGEVDLEDKKQITIVMDMLGNKLEMLVSKFTSEETTKDRKILQERFSMGNMLQVLVAIRCLDEGVNIPGIKTAFILASSTNPKEYIQRRGRVLRKAPDKVFAEIYDFITLPRNIDEPTHKSEFLNSEYSLIRREYERMENFAKLAENTSEVTKLMDRISNFYQLYYNGGKDYGI